MTTQTNNVKWTKDLSEQERKTQLELISAGDLQTRALRGIEIKRNWIVNQGVIEPTKEIKSYATNVINEIKEGKEIGILPKNGNCGAMINYILSEMSDIRYADRPYLSL